MAELGCQCEASSLSRAEPPSQTSQLQIHDLPLHLLFFVVFFLLSTRCLLINPLSGSPHLLNPALSSCVPLNSNLSLVGTALPSPTLPHTEVWLHMFPISSVMLLSPQSDPITRPSWKCPSRQAWWQRGKGSKVRSDCDECVTSCL